MCENKLIFFLERINKKTYVNIKKFLIQEFKILKLIFTNFLIFWYFKSKVRPEA